MMRYPEEKDWRAYLNRWFPILVIIGVLVNATGLLVPIIEPDGALYAEIAKRIALSGDWINLVVKNADWLDKPHFPFWMAAASFKIFGVNSFAYKLPAFLFWLMAIGYTYRLARMLFDLTTAQVAVLITLTAFALALSNNDVRAEPYLTGLVTGAVFHILKASEKKKWLIDVLLASLYTGCAMMTKGPFVLMPIFGGFILWWMFNGDWKQYGRLKWWLTLGLSILFVLPELYALYFQFDLHPEKTVFGKHNISGVRFFFWDSQFGRFFNTGPIKGKGDPSFYLHTTLWAFLPWSIAFSVAIGNKIGNFRRGVRSRDFVLVLSVLATFLLFFLVEVSTAALHKHYLPTNVNYHRAIFGAGDELQMGSGPFRRSRNSCFAYADGRDGTHCFLWLRETLLCVCLDCDRSPVCAVAHRKQIGAENVSLSISCRRIVYWFRKPGFLPCVVSLSIGQRGCKID